MELSRLVLVGLLAIVLLTSVSAAGINYVKADDSGSGSDGGSSGSGSGSDGGGSNNDGGSNGSDKGSPNDSGGSDKGNNNDNGDRGPPGPSKEDTKDLVDDNDHSKDIKCSTCNADPKPPVAHCDQPGIHCDPVPGPHPHPCHFLPILCFHPHHNHDHNNGNSHSHTDIAWCSTINMHGTPTPFCFSQNDCEKFKDENHGTDCIRTIIHN